MSDDSEEYGGKLIIRNLKMEDNGEYECYLPSGQASDKVRLTVLSEQSNENTKVEFNREVDENVELTCHLSDHRQSKSLKWRKVDGVNNFYWNNFNTKNLKI
jgi:hypothetical protein